MDGRFFSTRKVEAYIADGSERFRKSGERKLVEDADGDEEEGKRLDQFGTWLEAGKGAGEGGGEGWVRGDRAK